MNSTSAKRLLQILQIGFYLYKVCDSIIELDINERVRRDLNASRSERRPELEEVKVKKLGTKSSQ